MTACAVSVSMFCECKKWCLHFLEKDSNHSPIAEYKRELTPASNVSVIKSPRLAAMGVATLSGLTFILRDSSTTPTISEPVLQSHNTHLKTQLEGMLSRHAVYLPFSC